MVEVSHLSTNEWVDLGTLSIPPPSKGKVWGIFVKRPIQEIGMKIRFAEPVPKFFTMFLNGQKYTAMDTIDYTTKIGAMIDMREWIAECWDCDASFVALATPFMAPEKRRCKNCSKPGVKTKGKPGSGRVA